MPFRILLIDNSIAPESRILLALREVGQVIRARSVLEAIAQCDQLQPDIVVADCPVEGLDAEGIYADLKDNGCLATVIALADRDPTDDSIRGKGPDVILPKPLTDTQLLVAVRDVLGGLPGREGA